MSYARRILYLFIVTRVLLIFLGVLALSILGHLLPPKDAYQHWIYPHNLFLKMWTVWDSGWYLDIARYGYTNISHLYGSAQANAGFFPLYPLLMKLASYLFLGNLALGGLLISNVALFVGLLVLFKLMTVEYDEETAWRVVKYFIFLPAGFILSGVMTEGLFVCFLLLTFYFARKQKWMFSGIFGFFAGLTRITGLLVPIPLFIMYSSWLKASKSSVKSNVSIAIDTIWLMLPWLGAATFFSYLYVKFGDFFLYFHIQKYGWGHELSNPLRSVIGSFLSQNPSMIANAVVVSLAFIALVITMRKVRLEYSILGFLLLLLGPISGSLDSTIRYLTINFVVALSLTRIIHKDTDDVFIPSLALIQGVMFVFWVNTFYLVL